ncbi:hypothetical protein PC122_g11919 [Phytophthora cactorum]|nr:hypothetical protein PC122_g11919 [Phytophthora cactorum]
MKGRTTSLYKYTGPVIHTTKPPWSKTLPKKKPTGRKEAAVTLPVLARRPSGQVATTVGVSYARWRVPN